MPSPNWLKGTDVSSCQGKSIDWASVRDGCNVRFAICKATDGRSTDSTFVRDIAGASDAGLLIGSYHVFEPGVDPIAQAKHYFDVAGQEGACDIPPIIDFERHGGCSNAELLERARAFVLETERLWRRPCVIYTGRWFWDLISNPAAVDFAARDLWVSDYRNNPAPALPSPWAEWRIWQYDGNGGEVFPDGTDADFDWFAGTHDELLAWCDSTGRTSGPKPAELSGPGCVLEAVAETPHVGKNLNGTDGNLA